jgi:hypothetical protein
MPLDLWEDAYPLSPVQQGILFHSLDAGASGVYVQQLVCSLHEDLDLAAFRRAWQQLLERHAALRTSFHWEGLEEALQRVHRHGELPIHEEDWRGLAETEQRERLDAYLRSDRRRGFDLAQGPLIRQALFRTGDADYRWVWSSHHAILDGRSRLQLLEEFSTLYEGFCRGESEVTLPPPRPYREHIEWLAGQDLSSARSFWQDTLRGFTEPTKLLLPMPLEAVSEDEPYAGSKRFACPPSLAPPCKPWHESTT